MNNDSFYSIDRLVEFGLSMAVANQMIEMMNQSMKKMYVPGMPLSATDTLPQNIYVVVDGSQVGPLSSSEFNNLISQEKVNKKTLAWIPGIGSWKPVLEIPSLLKIIALTPPPLPEYK